MSEDVPTIEYLRGQIERRDLTIKYLRLAIDKAIQFLQDEDSIEAQRLERILYSSLSYANGVIYDDTNKIRTSKATAT